MSFRNLLLERLKQSDTQFDEVLFRLEESYPGLRGQISAREALSQRAIQLIRFLEQDPEGLSHLCQRLGEPFTIPGKALVELEKLLERAEITEDRMRSVFSRYLKTLGKEVLWNSPNLTSQPLWDELLSYLADPVWMHSDNKHHLLEFISRLAPYSAGHSPHLRNWVHKTATALGIPPPGAFHAGNSVDEKTQPYLLLALSPEGNYYTLYAWFMNDPGEYHRIYEEKLGANLNDMPRHLNAILVRDEITATCRLGHPPILEFFLPASLLNHGLDQWRLPGEKRPLSTQYCLVLRAGERLWYKRWMPDWGRYWHRHCGALCEAANQHHAIWLERPARGGYSTHLDGGQWIFGLDFVPDSDCLETLLEAGVGILLWPRQEAKQEAERIIPSIKTQMKQQIIQDLPEWLRKWRKAYWEKCDETGSMALLWDDPQRMPDDYRPLPPPPDF